MAKKKKNGLSIAIVALNAVIVGIIILLIVLIYFHMKEDVGNGRTEQSTIAASDDVSESESVSDTSAAADETTVTGAGTETQETTTENTSETTVDTELPVSTDSLILPQYDRAFFDNDLFIGDSISTGFHLYDYLDAENVFAEVGLNPESALSHKVGDVTCVEKAAAMQPKHIYIMLGSNGLAYMDTGYMSQKMTELVSELEMACYTAEICIISLPPVTKEHDAQGKETMEKINDYNSKLKTLCEQGGYTYIDVCSKLTDEEGYFFSKYAEADGLHFQGGAYALVLGTIQNQIG